MRFGSGLIVAMIGGGHRSNTDRNIISSELHPKISSFSGSAFTDTLKRILYFIFFLI